jgi:YggT family protein
MSPLRILFQVLVLLIRLYNVVLLLRVMLTWLRISPYSNPFAKLLYDLTEPVLEPIRAVIPPVAMLDLSPLIVMLLLFALERALGILATGL